MAEKTAVNHFLKKTLPYQLFL